MNKRSIVRSLAGLATALIMGFGASARAWWSGSYPMRWDPQTPAGWAVYDCHGNPIWGMAGGYNSSGALRCAVRQYSSQEWTPTYYACGATDATQFSAEIPTFNTTFCSKKTLWWNGTAYCPANLITMVNGVCSNVHEVDAYTIAQ